MQATTPWRLIRQRTPPKEVGEVVSGKMLTLVIFCMWALMILGVTSQAKEARDDRADS